MVDIRLKDQEIVLPKYKKIIEKVDLTPFGESEGKKIAKSILSRTEEYAYIEKTTKVPRYFIAGLHSMECSLDFTKHLANGDPIDKSTINEPKGIPGGTFVSTAISALWLKNWINRDKDPLDWEDRLKWLWRAELYNGWGYRLYFPNIESPYLWSGTTAYSKGKYKSDGVMDLNLVSSQVGIFAIWRCLGLI